MHEIKIAEKGFKEVVEGRKCFEVRKNDCGYQVGDLVVMKEYVDGNYTDRFVRVRITYILENIPGIEKGYCVWGFAVKGWGYIGEEGEEDE